MAVSLRSAIAVSLRSAIAVNLRSAIAVNLRSAIAVNLRSAIAVNLRKPWRSACATVTAGTHGFGQCPQQPSKTCTRARGPSTMFRSQPSGCPPIPP
jgi:hypothetical protein